MRSLNLWICFAWIASSFSANGANKKQPLPPSPPPEVLARVRAAHNIFVSNATVGVIVAAKAARQREYYHYSPYKDMYCALAAWPDVNLVDAPAKADLVFQIMAGQANLTGNQPIFASTLTIIDPQKSAVLLQETIPLISTLIGFTDASFAKATAALLQPLEPLQPAPKPLKVTVPMPAQLHAGSKVFVQPSPPGSQFQGIDVAQMAHDAFAKVTFYTPVDSPADADLVIAATVTNSYIDNNYQDEQQLLLEAFDPKTNLVLWTQLCAVAMSRKPLNKQISDTFPYALKYWNSLATQSHVGN